MINSINSIKSTLSLSRQPTYETGDVIRKLLSSNVNEGNRGVNVLLSSFFSSLPKRLSVIVRTAASDATAGLSNETILAAEAASIAAVKTAVDAEVKASVKAAVDAEVKASVKAAVDAATAELPKKIDDLFVGSAKKAGIAEAPTIVSFVKANPAQTFISALGVAVLVDLYVKGNKSMARNMLNFIEEHCSNIFRPSVINGASQNILKDISSLREKSQQYLSTESQDTRDKIVSDFSQVKSRLEKHVNNMLVEERKDVVRAQKDCYKAIENCEKARKSLEKSTDTNKEKLQAELTKANTALSERDEALKQAEANADYVHEYKSKLQQTVITNADSIPSFDLKEAAVEKGAALVLAQVSADAEAAQAKQSGSNADDAASKLAKEQTKQKQSNVPSVNKGVDAVLWGIVVALTLALGAVAYYLFNPVKNTSKKPSTKTKN